MTAGKARPGARRHDQAPGMAHTRGIIVRGVGWLVGAVTCAVVSGASVHGQNVSLEAVALHHSSPDVSAVLLGAGSALRFPSSGVIVGFQYVRGSDERQREICVSTPPDIVCGTEHVDITSRVRSIQVGYAVPAANGRTMATLIPLVVWSHVETTLRDRERVVLDRGARPDIRIEARVELSRAIASERLRVIGGVAGGTSLWKGEERSDGRALLTGYHKTASVSIGLTAAL